MGNENVVSLADALTKGKSAKEVLRGTIVPYGNAPQSESIEATTPVVVVPKEDAPAGSGDEFHRLGWLRPKDTFTFVRHVPQEGVDLMTEYKIVPANRGFLAFTDDFSTTWRVPIDASMNYKVRITFEDESQKTYTFYPGDRVKNRDTGATGEVIRPKAAGYEVLFEGYDDTTWMAQTAIRLVDKDQTTRKYITQNDAGECVVSYADRYEIFKTPVEALRFLMRDNRTAFFRLSIMIANESPPPKELGWVDIDVINFLVANDARMWNQSMAEGYFDEPASIDDAVAANTAG